MDYSATTRDRFRLAVTAVSGLTTVAALSATGWLAGHAARDHQAEQARKAAEAGAQQQAQRAWERATRAHAAAVRAAAHPHVVLRTRPQVTRVSLRYVRGAASAPVGGGGQVSSYSPTYTPQAASSAPQSQPAPYAAPPPPPPPPAPAPSTGS